MSGIEKGVALRQIARVLYQASKGGRNSRPMLGRFGMIDCEKSVRYKSDLINPSFINENIERIKNLVKSHNRKPVKNNDGDDDDDDDDDDDNDPSSGLGGMILANKTVFVGPHTVHPERQYS